MNEPNQQSDKIIEAGNHLARVLSKAPDQFGSYCSCITCKAARQEINDAITRWNIAKANAID